MAIDCYKKAVNEFSQDKIKSYYNQLVCMKKQADLLLLSINKKNYSEALNVIIISQFSL